jgi:hypothetical protein
MKRKKPPAQRAVKAAEEPQPYNELFEKAFRSCPMLMSLSDVETGRLIDVNEEMAAFCGQTRTALIGRTAGELGLWADPANG